MIEANKLYTVFITSYQGKDVVEGWLKFEDFPNTDIFIIDNGGQDWKEPFKSHVIHTNLVNIGCAGIWNVSSDIGFDYLKKEKIVISNDDNTFNEALIKFLYDRTDNTGIVGAYGRGFAYSLYCLHKDIFSKVGRFDEGYLRVSCEDNDYIYRCDLLGITNENLGINADYNLSLSSKKLEKHQRQSNIDYINEKWGNPRTYKVPFDEKKPFGPRQEMVDIYKDVYPFGQPYDYPSEFEYQRFLTEVENKPNV
jgi:hypothetical protein